MKIVLTTQNAPQSWGENATLSFSEDLCNIHLKKNYLVEIQKAARTIKSQGINKVELSNFDGEQCFAFFQGYDAPKNKGEIEFPRLDAEETKTLENRIKAVSFVKDIINTPSDIVTPQVLAQRAADFIEEVAPKGSVSYRIIKGEQLIEEKLMGIHTVGKGAVNKPCMLELDFNPNNDEKVAVSLVGKGISFDTGGYSLKPSNSMAAMKADMGGSALVTGSLGLAIMQGLNKRVKLYLCCAENSISGDAMKLSDIITYANGVTAEILNTDAEGRLVLADGLIRASNDKPNLIIDCATLTGAAKVAVGNDYHSVLSIDDARVQELFDAFNKEHEPLWRLPFEELHRGYISSSFADIVNTSSVAVSPGASTACAFLSYFVENYEQNWLHIDCCATYRPSGTGLYSAGATGIGVRSLARLLLETN